MTDRPVPRRLAALLTTAVLILAGGASAHADDIQNSLDGTLDSTVEVMALNTGATQSTAFTVTPRNGDTIGSGNAGNGCNLKANATLTVAVDSSAPAVATVSPTSLTFTSCNDVPTVTVHGLSVGSTTITLRITNNGTQGTFNLAPATFQVNVAAPPNTPPTVTVGGVADKASYVFGAVPLPTCTAVDTEDGTSHPTPTVGPVTGPDAAYGIGTQTVVCSYTDQGGLTASTSATYTITKASSTTKITCDPTSVEYNAAPQTPCTATATGPGLSTTVPVTYVDNTNAGTAKASASYAGDPAHTGSTAEPVTFTITKAGSTVKVSCADVTYNASAQDPCTAQATGIGLTPVPLTPSYTEDTKAGTWQASASWSGDANHSGNKDRATFTIAKADSTTTLSCPAEVEYTGDALSPCTATVVAVGVTGAAATVSYEHNIGTGTATAHATWDGDENHKASSDSATFTITRAPSAVQVSCGPGPFVYDGTAFDPCTATVTGTGGLAEGVPVTYDPDATNAGDVTATGTFAGDANHKPSTGTGSFTILKASSTVTITCDQGPFVFDGIAKESCSARVKGAGGLDEAVDVSYVGNVHAGTVQVTADYAGDANHSASSDATSFAIAKAPSTVTVTCSDVTYNGSAQTPCTATASGVAMDDVAVTISPEDYTGNTDAGTASVTVAWAGDADHDGSTGSKTFTIAKATTTTKLTCPASVVYTGTDRTPCTATVTGPSLSDAVDVQYAHNLLAGTATAHAAYVGSDNYLPSFDDATFEVTKATSHVTVTCTPSTVTYTGSALTPCTAVAGGVGMSDVPLTVVYGNNTGASTAASPATASASWGGDDNHVGSDGSTTFTIAKASSLVTVSCPASVVFTGSPITPCTASVSGVGGLSQSLTVSYTGNTATGTATATATYAGDANHLGSTGSQTFTIASWTLKGFYAPVDMNGVWNTVKNGSTVPLKFEAFAGATEITTTAQLGATFTVKGVACPGSGAVTDDIELTTTGATSLRYDTTGGQFIQNWQTPKKPGACYQVTMTAADGSSLTANFILR